MDDNTQPEIDTIWVEAKSFIEQRNFDRAIETYKYILIRYGDTPIAVECANANLGDIYLTMGQLDSAEIYIKKAISCDTKKPDYHYLLGFLYSKREKWKSATKEFQTAIKVEPDNPEYLRGLGWALFSLGEQPKGLELLHKANDLAPSNVNVLLDLTMAYLIIHDFNKARIFNTGILRIDPGNKVAQELKKKIIQIEQIFKAP